MEMFIEIEECENFEELPIVGLESLVQEMSLEEVFFPKDLMMANEDL